MGFQQRPVSLLAELEVGMDNAGDHVDELQVWAVAAVDGPWF